MTDITVEFPGYPVDTLPAIPAGFVATHWHNDACPSWQRGNLRLFVDYPDPDAREIDAPRFSLQRDDDDGVTVILDSDDWSAILDAIAKEG